MITPAPVQVAYNQYEVVGQLGQVATMTTYEIDTRIADDPASVGIGFGLAVSQGTLHGDKSATLGQDSGGAFIGITAADPTLPNLSNLTGQFTDAYSDSDNMAVLTLGDIWVHPVTAVDSGNSGYFNSVTGALGDSTTPNGVEIVGSKWQTSLPRPANELVKYNGFAVLRLGIMG